MSLTSFLLGKDASKSKGKSIDTGLDDLFKSTAVAPTTTTTPVVKPPDAFISSKERKRKEAPVDVASTSKTVKRAKESKADNSATVVKPSKKSAPSKKTGKDKTSHHEPNSDREKVTEAQAKTAGPSENEDHEAGPSSAAKIPPVTNDSSDDSDEEGDPSKLVHESLLKGGKNKGTSKSKQKYVPSEETPEQRDARTLFVGNVPMEAVTSRPLQKQLKKHILSFVPTAKIESTRFRSVAFSKPTTETSDPNSSKAKDSRQHNRDRAASWRESNSKTDEDAAADKGKTFLTQKEKKRIFFINQELHSGVDSVNAYVVFAHSPPASEDKPSTVMDPYEAAKTVIREADGSQFHGHSLRIDTALKGKGKANAGNQGDVEVAGDPKATIFVGNLDFACKEEDVRAFFEKVMTEERGSPSETKEEENDGEDDDEDEDEASKEETHPPVSKTWVKRVRIIRDKDTLLGKGFGYVQFTDRTCVDEILAMDEAQLKFAKRKLRVQRCKTLPGASKPTTVKPPRNTANSSTSSTPRKASDRARPVSIPKGDPSLGTKLAGLSKEDRKKAKSTDADRVARRLAKKKAKALAEKGVKARVDGGKTRERVRKPRAGKSDKGGVPERKKAKTGRVRSGKALAKMNMKK